MVLLGCEKPKESRATQEPIKNLSGKFLQINGYKIEKIQGEKTLLKITDSESERIINIDKEIAEIMNASAGKISPESRSLIINNNYISSIHELDGNAVIVVGKHSYFSLHPDTGKITFMGSD